MNHGCNGTKNFGSNPDSTITETNFDPSSSSTDDLVDTAPVTVPSMNDIYSKYKNLVMLHFVLLRRVRKLLLIIWNLVEMKKVY